MKLYKWNGLEWALIKFGPFVVFIVAVGCVANAVYNYESPPRLPEPRHTVWVGTGIVSVGHACDSYELKDGFVSFTNSRSGVFNRVPVANIARIDGVKL